MGVEGQHNCWEVCSMCASRQLPNDFLMPPMYPVKCANGKPGIVEMKLIKRVKMHHKGGQLEYG
jgi:hypothetical protein